MTLLTTDQILSALAVLVASAPVWGLLVLVSAVALIRRKGEHR